MNLSVRKKIEASKNQRGATMVEYAIMVALIAIVAIGSVTLLGKKVDSTFSTVDASMG